MALDSVSIEIYSGEILAIVGDNGAGKSTLVKTLSGAITPDAGEISIHGSPVRFDSPQRARQHGIETVYQDLALAPNRDVVQNLYLGREICLGGILEPFGFLSSREMRRVAEQHLKELEVGLPRISGLPIGQMSGGQRQCVAVARAAFWSSKVMFMDEPTAALGVREFEKRYCGSSAALLSPEPLLRWSATQFLTSLRLRTVLSYSGMTIVADLRGSVGVEDVVNLIVGSGDRSPEG